MSHRRCGQRDALIVVGDGHLFRHPFGILKPKRRRLACNDPICTEGSAKDPIALRAKHGITGVLFAASSPRRHEAPETRLPFPKPVPSASESLERGQLRVPEISCGGLHLAPPIWVDGWDGFRAPSRSISPGSLIERRVGRGGERPQLAFHIVPGRRYRAHRTTCQVDLGRLNTRKWVFSTSTIRTGSRALRAEVKVGRGVPRC
jgi:hypothetical protein